MSEIIEPVVEPSQVGRQQPEKSSKLLRYGDQLLDLVKIAKGQRAFLYCLLGNILSSVLMILLTQTSVVFAIAGCLLNSALAIVLIVLFARLALAIGHHLTLVILSAIFMLVPIVGLVPVLYANGKASVFLKMGGVRVGLLGVSEREMVKLYADAVRTAGTA